MEYIVMFNTAAAQARLPLRRRSKDWERQLVDDFIRGIHGKKYHCKNREELMRRLNFISGCGGLSWEDEENHVKLDSAAYAEKILPASMYGIPQGYVDFNERIKPLEYGRRFVFIKFNDFYDIRQRRRFGGCYIEIINAGEEAS